MPDQTTITFEIRQSHVKTDCAALEIAENYGLINVAYSYMFGYTSDTWDSLYACSTLYYPRASTYDVRWANETIKYFLPEKNT